MNKAVASDVKLDEEPGFSLEENLKNDISLWLVMYLEKILNLPKDNIDVEETFSSFGMDSSAAIGLTGDLGQWLGYDVDPSAIYDNPTIETLAEFLSKESEVKKVYFSRKENLIV